MIHLSLQGRELLSGRPKIFITVGSFVEACLVPNEVGNWKLRLGLSLEALIFCVPKWDWPPLVFIFGLGSCLSLVTETFSYFEIILDLQ